MAASTRGVFNYPPQTEKENLIKNLNAATLEIYKKIIHKDSRRITDKELKPFFSGSSFEDPYQLDNIKAWIQNKLVPVQKQIQSYTQTIPIATILAIISIVIALFSDKDRDNKINKEPDDTAKGLYALTTWMVAHALIHIGNRRMYVESESQWTSILTAIDQCTRDNRRLSALLNRDNPHALDFRRAFFDSAINPMMVERSKIRHLRS